MHYLFRSLKQRHFPAIPRVCFWQLLWRLRTSYRNRGCLQVGETAAPAAVGALLTVICAFSRGLCVTWTRQPRKDAGDDSKPGDIMLLSLTLTQM